MNLISETTELCVCDSETLARYDDAVILSCAFTYGDLSKRVSVEQLIEENTFFMKFDARRQINDGRVAEKQTMDWWRDKVKVSDTARTVSLTPKPDDAHIKDFPNAYLKWAHKMCFEPKRVIHADRNLFDLKKLQHALEITYGMKDAEPWHYHNVIDIVSTLRAWDDSRYGSIDIRKLPNAVYHDPRWDAAVDWLRIQARAENSGILTVGG